MKTIKFISTLEKGQQLASIGYADCHNKEKRKQKSKVFLYTLLNLRFASKWFYAIEKKDFSNIIKNRKRLFVKPFRPYMSITLLKKEKQNIIFDTYSFIRQTGESFTNVIKDDKSINIATFPFEKPYDNMFLKLGYHEVFRKEGELILQLVCDELGGDIITIAFSFQKNGAKINCLVGCIQGHQTNNNTISKTTQKLMFGLRPKALIMFALQEFARDLGCDAILGVSNKVHTFKKKHAIHIPWIHKLSFDYDSFWKEVGGKILNNAWFDVPLIPQRKTMEEIKSKKRSMYRKRFALLDNISEQISNSVETLKN